MQANGGRDVSSKTTRRLHYAEANWACADWVWPCVGGDANLRGHEVFESGGAPTKHLVVDV